ncbi:MAG: CAP domain-containing protein [Bacillota bacterium]
MPKRSLRKFSGILLCLAAALFLAALILPAGAEAYAAYSSSGSVTTYGIARSSGGYSTPYQTITQPAPPQPAPAPAPAPTPAPAPVPAPVPQTSTGSVTLNAQEKLLLELVNGERARRGLAPLRVTAQLTQLARLKSQDMINNHYFGHQSPVYGSSGDMLRSAGISFSMAAENIGVGGNVRTIFNAFMDSSGHRNKIVDSRYTQTGIGIIYKQGRGYLVTQLFVKPR